MAASGFIEPGIAVEQAKRGLARVDDRTIAAALRGSRAGMPELVLRLDAAGEGYYLIPWEDRSGIVLLVQVDARAGAMSSVAALSPPAKSLGLSAEQARRVAEEHTGMRATGEPRLVWQPCRESASPLQPLYQVFLRRGSVFVTTGGTVHERLTPFGKGG